MNRFKVYSVVFLIGVGVGLLLHPKASTDSTTQQNNVTTHETTTTVTNSRGTTKTTTKRDVVDRTRVEKELVIIPRKPILSVSALASGHLLNNGRLETNLWY